MIDSVRKSLSIESMEDIKLLIEIFYEFGPKKRDRLAKEEKERVAAKEAALAAINGEPTDKKKKKDDKGSKE